MRKYIAFLLVAILLLSSLAGCTQNPNPTDEEYTASIIGYSDSLGIKRLSVEYEIRDYEGFKDKKGPKNVTFKLQGKETTIDLSDSPAKFSSQKYYPIYEYGDMGFNPDGILERYYLYVETNTSDVKCSEENAVQLAKNFISDIVNVDDFTVTNIIDMEDVRAYEIVFVKYVDGIKTKEEAYVSVTYDGQVYSYVANMLGQFTKDTKNPFDMEKVKAEVYSRLEELTKDIKDKYDKIEYRDEEFRLTRLKDGSLAILYTGEIRCLKNFGEETQIGGERIKMLVMQ